MEPRDVAYTLNLLADYIDDHPNPSRAVVASDLQALLRISAGSHEAGLSDLLGKAKQFTKDLYRNVKDEIGDLYDKASGDPVATKQLEMVEKEMDTLYFGSKFVKELVSTVLDAEFDKLFDKADKKHLNAAKKAVSDAISLKKSMVKNTKTLDEYLGGSAFSDLLKPKPGTIQDLFDEISAAIETAKESDAELPDDYETKLNDFRSSLSAAFKAYLKDLPKDPKKLREELKTKLFRDTEEYRSEESGEKISEDEEKVRGVLEEASDSLPRLGLPKRTEARLNQLLDKATGAIESSEDEDVPLDKVIAPIEEYLTELNKRIPDPKKSVKTKQFLADLVTELKNI